MSGKSTLEVESYVRDFDSIRITQKDSSKVVIKMSPDLRSASFTPSHSWETMYVGAVDATVRGASLLDIGHSQINSLKLIFSNTSIIIFSGKSFGK